MLRLISWTNLGPCMLDHNLELPIPLKYFGKRMVGMGEDMGGGDWIKNDQQKLTKNFNCLPG